MQYYFVAKKPGKRFVGQFTSKEITSLLKSGYLNSNYFAAENPKGMSFNQFIRAGTEEDWKALSDLVGERSACPSTTEMLERARS